ncbi:hypothetical protein EGR_07841 [Echinococcus granulosus]|uniref:Uncharacterized protein n=1 Tax=Echinococcus granulosus TaxID=6210 RepID=W6U823_ECHGR|nr:hypothetical protein EGR_07841 [Echinococcus granulosus]EUB57305.1 hypothetical protein EGR_07841 [Echinococcus granulosus]
MSPSQSITLSESTLSKTLTRVSGSTLKSSDQDDSKYEEQPFNPNANTADEKSLLNRSETINKKFNKCKSERSESDEGLTMELKHNG